MCDVAAAGRVLWEGDTSVLKDTWNTYNVLILPDLTGDGVGEVLLPHGGDPSFSPTVTNNTFSLPSTKLLLSYEHLLYMQ